METLNKSYFRSMCAREYRNWEAKHRIDPGQEWTELEIARHNGYPLEVLKEWVDEGHNSSGPHDVIIRVTSSQLLEFALQSRSDRLGEGAGDEYMLPYRYANQVPIDFKRAEVVYDPRAAVSDEPVLDLEQMLKRPSFLQSLKGILAFFNPLKA
jgi:hypothetical protein